MSGQGDDRAEAALERAVASGPRDILGLLRVLRRDDADAIARNEGAIHALVHRLVREERLVPGGRSEAGLVLYGPRGAAAPKDAQADAAEIDVDPLIAKSALRVARGVRDPAARGRVLADVRAHLAELAEAGAPLRFGRTKVIATLMQRVDRGKATVVLVDGLPDVLRRLVLHEGPWIVGAAVVFFVLKAFVVSPFKIPSESMLPTLEKGDRVAVFTLLHDGVPDRYDVMVYERGGVNYVKRLVGLPGEEVALWRGDVYVDGELLVRPDWLVASLRSHVGAWRFGAETPTGFGRVARDGTERWWWRTGRFTAHHQGSVSFGMHDGFATLEGERAAGEVLELILAHGPSGTSAAGRGWILRIDDTGIRLVQREGMELTTGVAGETESELATVDSPSGGPTGAVTLALSYVDGVLRARAPGFTYEAAHASPSGDLSVGLGRSEGASGTLRLSLDRDHHYSTPPDATHGTPVGGERRSHRVPDDHVFCLGDNTTNSRDSRFSQVGDIPVDAIVGPVSIRIWPPTRWGVVK